MANPLFNLLGGNGNMSGPFGNFAQMMQQFNDFKRTFTGNPQEEVMKLLQSGKINQQQLNDLQAMAKQFEKLMK